MSSGTRTRGAEFATFMHEAGPALLRTAWLPTGDHHRAQELTQLNTDRRDLDAVVLSQPDGNQWISWASDPEIGVAGSSGSSRPEAVSGALRLPALPAWTTRPSRSPTRVSVG